MSEENKFEKIIEAEQEKREEIKESLGRGAHAAIGAIVGGAAVGVIAAGAVLAGAIAAPAVSAFAVGFGAGALIGAVVGWFWD